MINEKLMHIEEATKAIYALQKEVEENQKQVNDELFIKKYGVTEQQLAHINEQQIRSNRTLEATVYDALRNTPSYGDLVPIEYATNEQARQINRLRIINYISIPSLAILAIIGILT